MNCIVKHYIGFERYWELSQVRDPVCQNYFIHVVLRTPSRNTIRSCLLCIGLLVGAS